MIIPAIVCIAKLEQKYIEEFVKYHIKLGFKYIFIYDNENSPTYENQLNSYSQNVKVIHFPGKAMQYKALEHFTKIFMLTSGITHAIHIDVDEFIALKKHANIVDFINEYIKSPGNNLLCGGIAINWKFFGSSGHKIETDEPVTQRFTMCSFFGDQHIKTLFNVRLFEKYNTCHDIRTNNKYYKIKSTDGRFINGPFNINPDTSTIQLNHYKCKTLPEFLKIRQRGRADCKEEVVENIQESFKIYDKNDTRDLTAQKFYFETVKP